MVLSSQHWWFRAPLSLCPRHRFSFQRACSCLPLPPLSFLRYLPPLLKKHITSQGFQIGSRRSSSVRLSGVICVVSLRVPIARQMVKSICWLIKTVCSWPVKNIGSVCKRWCATVMKPIMRWVTSCTGSVKLPHATVKCSTSLILSSAGACCYQCLRLFS